MSRSATNDTMSSYVEIMRRMPLRPRVREALEAAITKKSGSDRTTDPKTRKS
jgi:hypothetical protein